MHELLLQWKKILNKINNAASTLDVVINLVTFVHTRFLRSCLLAHHVLLTHTLPGDFHFNHRHGSVVQHLHPLFAHAAEVKLGILVGKHPLE